MPQKSQSLLIQGRFQLNDSENGLTKKIFWSQSLLIQGRFQQIKIVVENESYKYSRNPF